MTSPINTLLDQGMACSVCKRSVSPTFACGCWEKCSCGWLVIAGTPCRNLTGLDCDHSSWVDGFLSVRHYKGLKRALGRGGYRAELEWAESMQPCRSADDFALEHAFVVCHSGMKAQIARPIFERIKERLLADGSIRGAFGHMGKVRAIETVWDNRDAYYGHWHSWVRDEPIDEQLAWLRKLPWIGKITAYHLAKNLGVDCCKPDRHLVRLAEVNDTDPETLCHGLAAATGDRVATVDTVLWRAANLGWV